MLVLVLSVTSFVIMKSHLIALVLNFLFCIMEALGKATVFYTLGTLWDIQRLSNAWIFKK